MMRAFFLAVTILVLATSPAPAWDAGVILGQSANISGAAHDNLSAQIRYGDFFDITRRTSVVPWLTAPISEWAELYFSLGLSLEHPADGWSLVDEVQLVPEVFRFELSFAPSDTFGISLGRIPFRDSLGWIMGGLFDGILFSLNNPWGRIDAGVFYTGLLYKDAVSINLSQHDNIISNGNNRYFASRRLVGSINWEQTGIFETRSTIRLGGLFQADLNNTDERIHSQYFLAGTSISFGRGFSFDMGTVLLLTQDMQGWDMDMYPALAASLDFRWLHSGIGTSAMPAMLSLGGKFASGEWGETIGVFVPFSGPALGRVLLPDFSGTAMARAAYVFHLHRSLVAELFAACLLRTDMVTFTGGFDENSDSPLLGWEVFSSLSWAAFPDLIFTLGGGIFLPGPAFTSDAHIRYRLDFTAVFSL